LLRELTTEAHRVGHEDSSSDNDEGMFDGKAGVACEVIISSFFTCRRTKVPSLSLTKTHYSV